MFVGNMFLKMYLFPRVHIIENLNKYNNIMIHFSNVYSYKIF